MWFKLVKHISSWRPQSHRVSLQYYRFFLSESYQCREEWNRRFEIAPLSKINPRNFYFELDQRLQNANKISAVDVDIFINSVKDSDFIDEVTNIIHQLRISPETSNTLESTHHAFIRYMIDCNEDNLLLEILQDRLNYGIFPDHLCSNLMMDKFIERKDYESAAKVASFLMLQEDRENIISNTLGIYSCYKHSQTCNMVEAPEATEATEATGDKIKVRVAYVRNPFFDDHFDISKPKHLVGKSLVFFGNTLNDAVGRSCILCGYVLWSKFDHAAKAIQMWIDHGVSEIIYEEIISFLEKEVSGNTGNEDTSDIEKFKIQLTKLKNLILKSGSITDEIENRLLETITQKEKTDIVNQKNTYDTWNERRIHLLKEQIHEMDRNARLENIKTMKNNLEKQERLLTFFDNEDKIELQIEQKLEMERKKFGPPIQNNASDEENYVPPDITRRRAV